MDKFYIHTPTGQIVEIGGYQLKVLLYVGCDALKDYVKGNTANPLEVEALEAFGKLIDVYGQLKK